MPDKLTHYLSSMKCQIREQYLNTGFPTRKLGNDMEISFTFNY